MLCSDSSHFHVINRPATLNAELPQAMSESSEEPLGIRHILCLCICKRNYHQQIVGFILMSEVLCGTVQGSGLRIDQRKCHKQIVDIVMNEQAVGKNDLRG
jgi:hypothetical protein